MASRKLKLWAWPCPARWGSLRRTGCRMGAEALLALMNTTPTPTTPALVVSTDGNTSLRVPLMACFDKSRIPKGPSVC